MTQDRADTNQRRGESFWRRTLTAQHRSGLTQSEFCQHNDLALSTFQYWRRRLRCHLPAAVPETADATAFVELAMHPRPIAADAAGFELFFPSGVRLKLPACVEGRALAEVLWALEATGTC